MHFFIFFFALYRASFVFAQGNNITIDDLDESVIFQPIQAWRWSNEGIGTFKGTFSFSGEPNVTVVFNFPVSATAIYWQGFKRSGGAAFHVCLDCSPNDDISRFITVDGHDDDPNLTNTITTLFALTGLSNDKHTFIIKNGQDPRFSNTSQITVDSFILTISENTSLPAITIKESSSMPAGPASTATSEQRTGLKTGAVVGVIVGLIAAFAITLLGLYFWWRRRLRKKYKRISFPEERLVGEESSSPMLGTLRQDYDQVEQLSLGTLSPTLNRAQFGAIPSTIYADPFKDESSSKGYSISAYSRSNSPQMEIGHVRTNRPEPTAASATSALQPPGSDRPLPQIATPKHSERKKEVTVELRDQSSSRGDRTPVAPSQQDVPKRKVEQRDPVQSVYSLYAKPSMYGKPGSNDEAVPEVPSYNKKTVNETRDPIQSVYSLYAKPSLYLKPGNKEEPMPELPPLPKETNEKRDALQSVYSLYGSSESFTRDIPPPLPFPTNTSPHRRFTDATELSSNDSLMLTPVNTNPRSKERDDGETTIPIILSNPFSDPRPDSNILSEYPMTPSDVSWRNSEYQPSLPPWPPRDQHVTTARTPQVRVAPPLKSVAGSPVDSKSDGEDKWPINARQRKVRVSEMLNELDEAIQNVPLPTKNIISASDSISPDYSSAHFSPLTLSPLAPHPRSKDPSSQRPEKSSPGFF